MKKVIGVLIIMVLGACRAQKFAQISPTQDAVFSLIVPDNNYGKLSDIHLYAWTQGGELNVNRVMLEFQLPKKIKSNKIDSAFLDLYYNNTSKYDKVLGGKGHQGNNEIIIQRLASEFNENEVTWNNQPEASTENQVEIPRSHNDRQDYIHIDVKGLIKNRLNKGSNKIGFLIKHKIEEPYVATFFASKDHEDKRLHPVLHLYYH